MGWASRPPCCIKIETHPKAYAPPRKAGKHEAMTDIRESIEELRYYREAFLPGPKAEA